VTGWGVVSIGNKTITGSVQKRRLLNDTVTRNQLPSPDYRYTIPSVRTSGLQLSKVAGVAAISQQALKKGLALILTN
jgi:hypothetical protein